MPRPAASFLTEFTVGGAPTAPQAAAADPASAAEQPTGENEEAAFARGREEGLAAAEADYRQKLEEERTAAAERLAAERASWAEQESTRLAGMIASAFDALQKDIADIVGAILEPFVEEALRTKSVDELAQALKPLLATGQHTLFRVAGPDDLLEALKQKLGDSATSFTFEVTDAVDLRVVVDRTVIETQLGGWLPQLGKREVA